MSGQTWRLDAACREHPAEVWFHGEASANPCVWDAPRAICNACPVQADCLAAALDSDEEHGMWGGLNPVERRRLQARKPRERFDVRGGCGTPSGYRRHQRRKERTCDDCRRAVALAARDRAQRKAAG